MVAGVHGTLQRIHGYLQQNPKAQSSVPFRLSPRGSQDQARRQKILDEYDGPDERTLGLLEQKHQDWREFPIKFWTGVHRYEHADANFDAASAIAREYILFDSHTDSDDP